MSFTGTWLKTVTSVKPSSVDCRFVLWLVNLAAKRKPTAEYNPGGGVILSNEKDNGARRKFFMKASCLLPCCQNESWCETINVKIFHPQG